MDQCLTKDSRNHSLNLEIYNFGPVKLLGLSRKGPQHECPKWPTFFVTPLVDDTIGKSEEVRVYQYLGNYPPTPPLTQH